MLEKVKISSVKLRSKIILAFVVVALLVGVTGAVGYHGVGVVDKEAHIIAEDAEYMDAATEMRLAVEQQQEAILYAELGKNERANELFIEGDDLFEEDLETFKNQELSDEESALVSSLETTHDEYDEVATAAIDAAEAGNMDLTEQQAAEAQALGAEIETQATELHDIEQSDLEHQVAVADASVLV